MSNIRMNQFYKTKTCPWFYKGRCERGDACRFAHSDVEKRKLPDLSKTSLCNILVKHGVCNKDGCRFAHNIDELRATDDMYKTSLCFMFMKSRCGAGDQCRHAHGAQELRLMPISQNSSNFTNNNNVSRFFYHPDSHDGIPTSFDYDKTSIKNINTNTSTIANSSSWMIPQSNSKLLLTSFSYSPAISSGGKVKDMSQHKITLFQPKNSELKNFKTTDQPGYSIAQASTDHCDILQNRNFPVNDKFNYYQNNESSAQLSGISNDSMFSSKAFPSKFIDINKANVKNCIQSPECNSENYTVCNTAYNSSDPSVNSTSFSKVEYEKKKLPNSTDDPDKKISGTPALYTDKILSRNKHEGLIKPNDYSVSSLKIPTDFCDTVKNKIDKTLTRTSSTLSCLFSNDVEPENVTNENTMLSNTGDRMFLYLNKTESSQLENTTISDIILENNNTSRSIKTDSLYEYFTKSDSIESNNAMKFTVDDCEYASTDISSDVISELQFSTLLNRKKKKSQTPENITTQYPNHIVELKIETICDDKKKSSSQNEFNISDCLLKKLSQHTKEFKSNWGFQNVNNQIDISYPSIPSYNAPWKDVYEKEYFKYKCFDYVDQIQSSSNTIKQPSNGKKLTSIEEINSPVQSSITDKNLTTHSWETNKRMQESYNSTVNTSISPPTNSNILVNDDIFLIKQNSFLRSNSRCSNHYPTATQYIPKSILKSLDNYQSGEPLENQESTQPGLSESVNYDTTRSILSYQKIDHPRNSTSFTDNDHFNIFRQNNTSSLESLEFNQKNSELYPFFDDILTYNHIHNRKENCFTPTMKDRCSKEDNTNNAETRSLEAYPSLLKTYFLGDESKLNSSYPNTLNDVSYFSKVVKF